MRSNLVSVKTGNLEVGEEKKKQTFTQLKTGGDRKATSSSLSKRAIKT